VAFIEMSVDVDQGRPNLPSAKIDVFSSVIALSARRFHTRKLAVFNQQIRVDDSFSVSRSRQVSNASKRACRHARIGQPKPTGTGPRNISESDRHWKCGGG